MTDLPVLNRSFVLTAAEPVGKRWSPACRQRARGFTLLELLTVIAIVVVLAGLILGGMGYAQQKAAASRATGEIAALSNLLEAFKADFGDYPKNDATIGVKTDNAGAALLAYSLFGRLAAPEADGDSAIVRWAKKNTWSETGLSDKATLEPVPNPEGGEDVDSRYLLDPFGNPYGYSTKGTYNPTFDLWSTAGLTTGSAATNEPRWIKNW